MNNLKDDNELKYSHGQMGKSQDTSGLAYETTGYSPQKPTPPTLREQAEKEAAFHFEMCSKAQSVASFLQLHPEFGEFIELLRSGAIQV